MPTLFTQSTTGLGPAGHLAWPLLDDGIFLWLYNILMPLLVLTIHKVPVAIALTAGYGVSWLYYRTYYGKEWSSMWCHAINFVGLVALIP